MKHYYVIVLLIILLFISTLFPCIEQFNSKNSNKILTSNRLNFEKLYPKQLISITDKAWDFVLFRINTGRGLDIFGSPGRVIMDPMDYDNYATKYSYKKLNSGYFFVFTSPNRKDDFQCGFDMSSKRIGYFDRTEKKLIDSILFGYRQKAKPVLLPLDKITNLNSIWSEVDLLVLYIIPKSPYLSIIQKQDLILLEMSNVSISRLNLTNPYLSLIQVAKIDIFNLNNKIVTPGPVLSVLELSMYIVDIKETKETFISRLKTSDEFKDPDFMCIGNPGATSKFQCDSPYTDQGEPKLTHNLWDKPCKRNSDCPYYRANKNYYNDFGRCMLDGKCQMPIGVLRVGYTKVYNKSNYAPFCYQCRNPKDTLCCEDQGVLIARGQSSLKSPDYAYPGDTELRKLNKLPTIISLQ